MFIHKSVFIIITSEGDIFKGKRISAQTERKLQCSWKKTNAAENKNPKKKTHTGAHPILLVHSNTGWKREREQLNVRMGFNTYRLCIYISHPILPSTASLFIFPSLPSPLPLLISGCLLAFSFDVPSPLKCISGVRERQAESRCCFLLRASCRRLFVCWTAQCRGQAAIPVPIKLDDPSQLMYVQNASDQVWYSGCFKGIVLNFTSCRLGRHCETIPICLAVWLICQLSFQLID